MAKNKGTYVDGFLLVVPKKNLAAYKKMVTEGAKLWKKYGALDYVEAVGNDLGSSTGGMKIARFPKIAGAKPSEVVVFSYITYKSRKHRDEVNKKVMKEMEQDPKNKEMAMPFDMARMAYGGFEILVSA